jgi:hypothetical protein
LREEPLRSVVSGAGEAGRRVRERAKAVEQIAILRMARDTMRRMEPPGWSRKSTVRGRV